MSEREPSVEKQIKSVQEDLRELGVVDPARFVPDGDNIAAAVVLNLLRREPGDYSNIPGMTVKRVGLPYWVYLYENWGITKKEEVRRLKDLYRRFLNPSSDFLNEVLKERSRRYKVEEREIDARRKAHVSEGLDLMVQKIDLVQLFGPTESETTKVKPGVGMADLGTVREFIEQKYPGIKEVPGSWSVFVFSAGTIIDAGRGAELDELMCERLLVASTPEILGSTVIFSSHLHQVMGQAGTLLAKKYLDLSAEEINLIQTTPLKPEHQKILALRRS